MANNSPTLVMASLSDDQLKKSIDSLVTHVDEAMKKMVQSTNNAVGEMEAKLKSLGNLKIDTGGSNDGGASKRAKKQQEETAAIKETTAAYKEQKATLDQQASAMQRASQPKSARESYYAFFQGFKEQAKQLEPLIANFERNLSTAISNRVSQLSTQISAHKLKIQELNQEINKNYAVGNTQGVNQAQAALEREIQTVKSLETELKNVNNEFTVQKLTLASMHAEHHRLRNMLAEEAVAEKETSTAAQQHLTEEQRITAEIKRRADEIRNSKTWQEKGHLIVGDVNYYDPERANMSKRDKSQLLSLEQQIANVMQEEAAAAEKNASTQRKSVSNRIEEQEAVKQEALYIEQLNRQESERLSISRQITSEEEKRKKYVAPADTSHGAYQRMLGNAIGVNANEIIEYDSRIRRLSDRLTQLNAAWKNLSEGERSSLFGRNLRMDIQEVSREIDMIRKEASRPVSFNFVKNLPVKTLDDMVYKLQQLRSYKMGIDITKPNAKNEIMQVDEAINKLQKDMNKYMGTGKSIIEQNNALSRSWNYMKNRLAFYFTVGASTQFVKNLIEVRSQYEMNERALGILIGSAEYGTKVFSELSQMSLISPYTLIELSAAAKQLTAYGIAARDVVDTTRRLADMASAVGVPIERLTYALGQIQAYGYLNSRDQRMFANAGIPLAAELAKYYTEIEGKLVSTGDVYDRIKKKAVGYADVMQVVYRMTDEGGQFFDFQAKMADTLKVRLANLTLAWNNMLNEIGKSEQGALTTGIGLLKDLFLKWKDVIAAVKSLIYAFGVFKVLQFTVLKGLSTQAEVAAWKLDGTTKGFAKLTNAANAFKSSMLSMAANPWTWVFVGITAIISLANAYDEAKEKARAFNSSLREGGAENAKNINSYLESMESLRKKLEQVQLDETNSPKKTSTGAIATVKTNIDESEAKKAWEAMREQIELASSSSSVYIQRLLQIENVSERLREGFAILENIKAVNQALSEVSDNTFKVEQSFSGWWNLWTLQDGLIQNLKDYNDALEGTSSVMSNVGKDAARLLALGAPIGGIVNAIIAINEGAISQWKELKSNIESTTESLKNFIAQRNWSSDPEKIQELYGQFTQKLALENQLDPKTAYYLQLLLEEGRTKATKEALVARMNDEYEAWKIETDEVAKMQLKASYDRHAEELNTFNQTTAKERVEWSEFTKYMANNHKSEIASMFRGMDEEQIKSLNFQEGEYKKWVDRMVKDYAKAHKMSYDEAFGYLKHWVQNANMWSIFIKLTIGTEGEKSLLERLQSGDEIADKSVKNIQRLKQALADIDKQIEAQKSVPLLKRGAEWQQKNTKLAQDRLEAEQAIRDAQKEKTKAEEEDYAHSKTEDKDAKKASAKAAADAKKRAREAAKAQREAESELQKTLKNELSLIDKVRSSYKTLTDAGVDRISAITQATSGYEKTVASINKVFAKWGIEKLDLSKFVGISNPRELVELLKKQLNKILSTGRAKQSEIKDLQVKVQELDVEAQTYDLKKITEGLDNELNKLKEEYELSLSLDADPELGNLFTDIFGIDTTDFPKTLHEMIAMAQDAVTHAIMDAAQVNDKGMLGDFDIVKGDLNKWAETYNIDVTSFLYKQLQTSQKLIRDIIKKDFDETSKAWDKLLEKYSEYEYKQTKISKDANQERLNLVKKFGTQEQIEKATKLVTKIDAEQDPERKEELREELRNLISNITEDNELVLKVSLAIDEKELQDQAKLSFEEFQKTPEWIVATGDLADMSKKAIGSLINQIEGYRRSAKNLSPKQIKEINKALKNLYKEQRKNNPFASIGNMLDEAKDRMAVYDEEIEKVEKQIEEATEAMETFIDVNGDGAEEQKTKLDKLIQKLEKLKKAQADAGEIDASAWVGAINETIGAVKSAIGVFNDLKKAIGGVEENDLDKVFGVLESAGQGAAIGAQIGGGYGAIIGGAIGAATSLIKIFATASDERITDQIKNSERLVKRLENTYKNLEHAADDAFGAQVSGAKRALRASKELQLAEAQRQLQLEKSRKSKNQDKDKIIELEGQIIDLKNEINDTTKDIVNDLLGISSAGDGIESMVSAMIDAFRNGEDVMKAFGDSFDEMVDNMILKLVVTQFMQKAWGNVLKKMQDKEEEMLKESSGAQAEARQKVDELSEMSDDEVRKMIQIEKEGYIHGWKSVSKAEVDAYRKAAEAALTNSTEELNKASLDYTKWSLDYMNTEGRDYLTQYATLLKDSLGNWYKYGENKELQLSNLQQGLQSMSEDTANALEAYANSISQQAYLRNDLLTQIRDAVIGMDMDVQVATQAQMLLQLQQSYAVQMAIQGILEGVLTPSGRAFAVELLS